MKTVDLGYLILVNFPYYFYSNIFHKCQNERKFSSRRQPVANDLLERESVKWVVFAKYYEKIWRMLSEIHVRVKKDVLLLPADALLLFPWADVPFFLKFTWNMLLV